MDSRREAVRRTARQTGALGRSTRTSGARPANAARRPRRRRGPISRRIAPDRGFLDRQVNPRSLLGRIVSVIVGAGVSGRRDRCRSGRGSRRRRRPLPLSPSVRGLPPGPVLERGADRERTRQAVRLLVRRGTRCRQRLRIAAVAMIGTRRTRFPIVLERDERTGRRAVHAGEPSLAHRRDDTCRGAAATARVGPGVVPSFDSPDAASDTARHPEATAKLASVPQRRVSCLD